MKIKIFTVLAILMATLSTFSQENLNAYKYIIVPKKYDFLKENDQYKINSLSKFLFEKYGFETVMEGEDYPEDLIRNRCLGLKSNVVKESGLFKTKLIVELKNCYDKTVFTSRVGETREKEYEKAYNLALRDAFTSFEELNHKFEPSESHMAANEQLAEEKKSETAMEIQKLKEEIETLKQEKIVEVAPVEPAMEVEAVKQVDPVKVDPIKAEVVKETPKETISMEAKSGVLYAQEIDNGFQLVDSTPKVVYKIKKTGLDHVFLVENMNATLYKKGDQWILEYYENGALKQIELTIKF